MNGEWQVVDDGSVESGGDTARGAFRTANWGGVRRRPDPKHRPRRVHLEGL